MDSQCCLTRKAHFAPDKSEGNLSIILLGWLEMSTWFLNHRSGSPGPGISSLESKVSFNGGN